MEDLKISYSNSVINSCGQITEFMYGCDMLDPAKMIKTNKGISFIDISHVADKLNCKRFLNLKNEENQQQSKDEAQVEVEIVN